MEQPLDKNEVGALEVGQPNAAEQKGAAGSVGQGAAPSRRSYRVVISIPVTVYGQAPAKGIFHEVTQTLVVNAHGALLLMREEVARQQRLVLVHTQLQREADCHVVSVKKPRNGEVEVGVEFEAPEPRFWGIAFPPPDWSSADRKRPDGKNASG